MAALTVDNTLFGAYGVTDQESYACPNRTIRRRIDFGKANGATSKDYLFIWIPKGYQLNAVLVNEIEKCDASTTVTLKTASDGATVGSAVNVGGSTKAKVFMAPVAGTKAKDEAGTGTVDVPGAGRFFASGEKLCVAFGAALAGGIVEVTLFGISTDCESEVAGQLPPPEFRAGQTEEQANSNVSGGDPLYRG